jgi:hypothetical protein
MLGVLFLSTLVGVAGCIGAGSASASARPVMAGSSTPAPPSGSVGPPRAHQVKFCVKHFAASSTVRVTNNKTGDVVRLHTNAKGAGCVQVPIKRACHSVRQTIVGRGTGDDGHPATVKQTVTTQPTPSKCSKTHRHRVGHHGRTHHKRHKGSAARLASANSASTHRFSGTDAAILALIAGLAIIAAGATLTLVRRRRAYR